jgi:hypothetical protein
MGSGGSWVEGKWEGREGRIADAVVGGSQAADTICQVLGGGSLKIVVEEEGEQSTRAQQG